MLLHVGCANELELLIQFQGEKQKLNGLKISMIVEKICDHPQARSQGRAYNNGMTTAMMI